MIDNTRLRAAIDSLNDIYVAFWRDITAIESPTSFKAGVDAVGSYIAEKARTLGWKTESHEEPVSGNPVCVTMNADAKGQPIALSGHMDTVHEVGSFGSPAVRIEGDIMYGPGVTDCKGGIVASFMAMHALQLLGFRDRPIRLLLESDEENSSAFSEKRTINWICDKARGCAAFLNAERHVPGMTVLQRKGIATYRLTVKGRTTHAMYCRDGVSAIKEVAHKVIELEKLQEPDGASVSCGVVSGGTVPNSVPEFCTLMVDTRFNNKAQMEQTDAHVRKIAATSYVDGSECTVELVNSRIPMELEERNLKLLSDVNAVLEENGLQKLDWRSSGGGSDAAEVTAAGIPVLDDFGTEGKYFHTTAEYGEISSLARAAYRIAVVVAGLK